MSISNVRRLAVFVALIMSFVQAASAADILIGDAKSQPESLTIALGGVLIVGSASSPFVYKLRPGSTRAEKFIDASTEGPGTFFFGGRRNLGAKYLLYGANWTGVGGEGD